MQILTGSLLPAPSRPAILPPRDTSSRTASTSRTRGAERGLPPARRVSDEAVLHSRKDPITSLPPDIVNEIYEHLVIDGLRSKKVDVHQAAEAAAEFRNHYLPTFADAGLLRVCDVMQKQCQAATSYVHTLGPDSSPGEFEIACRLMPWLLPKDREVLVNHYLELAHNPMARGGMRELGRQGLLLSPKSLEKLKDVAADVTYPRLMRDAVLEGLLSGSDTVLDANWLREQIDQCGRDADGIAFDRTRSYLFPWLPCGAPEAQRRLIETALRRGNGNDLVRLIVVLDRLSEQHRTEVIRAVFSMCDVDHRKATALTALAAKPAHLGEEQKSAILEWLGAHSSAHRLFHFEPYARACEAVESEWFDADLERGLIDLALDAERSATASRFTAICHVFERHDIVPPDTLERLLRAQAQPFDGDRGSCNFFWAAASACLWGNLSEQQRDAFKASVSERPSILKAMALHGLSFHLHRLDALGRQWAVSTALTHFERADHEDIAHKVYEAILGKLHLLPDSLRGEVLARIDRVPTSCLARSDSQQVLIDRALAARHL